MSDKQTIVSFPIQNSDGVSQLSDVQLVYELKLQWTKTINDAVEGRYKLTEKDKHALRRMNSIATSCGYSPLFNDDFENL